MFADTYDDSAAAAADDDDGDDDDDDDDDGDVCSCIWCRNSSQFKTLEVSYHDHPWSSR